MMNDPAMLMEPIMNETKRVLNEMKKTRDLNERKLQSEIVRNLCESVGVFFDFVTNAINSSVSPDFLDDDDDDDDDENRQTFPPMPF